MAWRYAQAAQSFWGANNAHASFWVSGTKAVDSIPVRGNPTHSFSGIKFNCAMTKLMMRHFVGLKGVYHHHVESDMNG
eukprot:m.443703 g.443703  ORF g.443703 m.443703 type:complete len:78 (+) comp18997_c0_seq1:835-1068(+)